MTVSRLLDSEAGLERTWSRNDGTRAIDRRSQLGRIVMAMLRDVMAFEANKK